MEQTQYNSLFSFIWSIATDLLDIVEKLHLRQVIYYFKEFQQRLIGDAVTGQLCVTKR